MVTPALFWCSKSGCTFARIPFSWKLDENAVFIPETRILYFKSLEYLRWLEYLKCLALKDLRVLKDFIVSKVLRVLIFF